MRVEWPDNFKQLYKERGQQRYGIRLLGLWKIQSGMSETKVCELIGKTHTSIRRWRQLYEEGGLAALLSLRKGRGRKARLVDKNRMEEALKEIESQKEGGRVNCQDVVDFIAKEYEIVYSRSGMYHVLHRFGFSWITSRSKHPKQDPQAIESFKKTLPV